jgi:hypothetical protein
MTTQKQTRNTGGPSQERRPRWPMGTTTVTGTTPPKASTARATVGSGSPPDSGGPRIEYVPRDDATLEGELTALVSVFRYLLLDRRERRGEDLAAHGAEERGEHAK